MTQIAMRVCFIFYCSSDTIIKIVFKPLASSSNFDRYLSLTNKMKSCIKSQESLRIKKRVCFDQIYVREYPVILGDNPSVTAGVPVTIDWNFQKEVEIELDYFEIYRTERKHKNQLRMLPNTRVELAITGGCTLPEIGQTALAIAKIQKHRIQSVKKTNWEILKEAAERKLHSTKRNLILEPKFTRIPNEVPSLLSRWEGRAKDAMWLNAAA